MSSFMDQLIERALAEARARGEFDNLPGMGRPIELSTLSADVFAKTLAESGAVHPIAFLGRRIKELRQRLGETADRRHGKRSGWRSLTPRRGRPSRWRSCAGSADEGSIHARRAGAPRLSSTTPADSRNCSENRTT
jgi:hypothetical protein